MVPHTMASRTGIVVSGRSMAPRRSIGAVASRRPVCMSASIQFIKGIDEKSVPDVRLTRSRDGSDGTAFFTFPKPSVFDVDNQGDIMGMFLVDAEGELTSVDVKAKFVNGKPEAIEAKYVMKSALEWDRFMRFMERYGEENGLAFKKA